MCLVAVRYPSLVPHNIVATWQTVRIADPDDLAGLLPREDMVAWLRRGEGMIGGGVAARAEFDSLAEAAAWWREFGAGVRHRSDLGEASGSGPLAFGSFVFDPRNSSYRSVLVVPSWIIGRRQGECWLTTLGDGEPPRRGEPAVSPGPLTYSDGAMSGPAWESVVSEAVRRIRGGALDKVVLARDLIAEADHLIDPRWPVTRLAAAYERCWTYHVDGLVGASPEMLVRTEGGLVTSRVLAGTIQRRGDAEADLALAAGLSRSSKDLTEHEYAVSSVARALAPYCSGMNVPDAPYVLDLPNVFHLATDVTAVARPDTTSLALAAALHPTAAVCGTPTEAARRTIAELEWIDRGRYSGPVGWMDLRGDGEWAIALRCGRVTGNRAHLFAGCGIVADSDPQAELAESVAKLVPMRDALEDD